MANLQLGETGTVIEVLFWDNDNAAALDVSGATTKQIKLYKGKRPGAIVGTYDASYSTDGTDGKIRITTTDPSQITASGDWEARGWVVKGGRTIPSVRGAFVVDP